MTQTVRFGTYEFELRSGGRLWCGEREIRLTPKAADVLKELVARAGTPVSREELFASVWTGTIVGDDALIVVRSGFAEGSRRRSPAARRYIAPCRRRGFLRRFPRPCPSRRRPHAPKPGRHFPPLPCFRSRT